MSEIVNLPPCGLYLTRATIGSVPAGRLVYFHNHGDPGPGIYLPETWVQNRAKFSSKGTTLTEPGMMQQLEPLEPEGFYRVAKTFHCCDKKCREYEVDELVQLGYDGNATPILFSPEIVDGAMQIPTRGSRIDRNRIASMNRLKVGARSTQQRAEGGEPGEDDGYEFRH